LIEQRAEATLPGRDAPKQGSIPPGRSRDRGAWIHIAGGRGWGSGLREVWHYREVFYFLAWRDIKVRYRQSVFGVGWAVLQPLLLMLVFAAFVKILHARTTPGVPYPVFALAALVPWTLFSQSLTSASESLVREANIVSKVFFPRVILPLASTAAFLLDFLISLMLLFVMMLAFSVYPTATALWVPLFTVLALLVSLSVGVLLAALNAMYRDVRAIVPFLAQVWLFASPVAYSSSLVPERWRFVYGLNPMVAVIDGFRWSLLGVGRPQTGVLAVSSAAAIVFFVGSLAYFRRANHVFADVI
jgi:lipopolysaccharide transport system permease protein